MADSWLTGAPPPEFIAMRERMVARGLLDADFRLTERGNARALEIMADLRAAEAANDPGGPRVFWRIPIGIAGRKAAA